MISNINAEIDALRQEELDELNETLAQELEDEYMAALGPYAYGPDADEDVGPWYWELK
jgi:hypothetical protein